MFQTAGRNSCSIVSRDVTNCSYRLTVHPVTSSRLSLAYQFFICETHPKPRGNRVASACVYFNGKRPALLTAERAVTDGRQRIVITCTTAAAAMYVCVCARTRVRACVRDVFAIYDNNI